MTNLSIYTTEVTPRIRYACQFIFIRVLKIKGFELTTNKVEFEAKKQVCKLNYSLESIPNIPFVRPHGLLNETTICKQVISPQKRKEKPFFFETDLNGVLPFDIFSFVFYLVSRYEEYLPFEADTHGRFTATQSLAHQLGFLQEPLVDYWIFEFGKQLNKLGGLRFQQPNFTYKPSYDIDYAFAFRCKGGLRQSAAFLRNLFRLDFETLNLQVQTWMGLIPDPFDTFDYLKAIHHKYALKPIYFWQVGKYGPHDKNISINKPAFEAIIHSHKDLYSMGIHPSYRSNIEQELLKSEQETLSNLLTKPVTSSRQHYLKLTFPETYQRLLEIGIKEDYTMGYATQNGFRASTAYAFDWFDLQKNKSTPLLVHPFMLMDVTLQNYQGFSIEEAIAEQQQIIENCRATGGQLMSIWHNNSFCNRWGWEGWREVYEALLEGLKEA